MRMSPMRMSPMRYAINVLINMATAISSPVH